MTEAALLAPGLDFESDALRRLDEAGYAEVRRCVDAADLLAVAEARELHLAVVAWPLPQVDRDLVDRLLGTGTRPVAVVADERAAQAARQLGFADAGPSGSLAAMIAQATAAPRIRTPPAPDGRIVAVWGPIGAPGRTTLAVNLAAELRGRRMLIDADTYGAAVAQQVGLLDEVSGLLAAVRTANHGRFDGLGAHVASLEPDWDVLTGLPRPDLWRHLRPAGYRAVLQAAVREYELVIVDVGFCLEPAAEPDARGAHRNGVALETLARASEVLAVGSADPVGLARLVRGLDELGADPSLRVVINRHDPSIGWTAREVADTVEHLAGRRPAAVLPFEYRSAQGALGAARTLREHAPRSALRRQIARIAATL